MSVSLNNSKGFTLIELIIALSVFSLAFTLLTITFVGLVRIQRNVASDRATQQQARRIVEDMTRDIRASNNVFVCGDSLYLANSASGLAYYTRLEGGEFRLFKAYMNANPTSCTVSINTSTETDLTANMSVPDIVITRINTARPGADIDITLKSGDSKTRMQTAATVRSSPATGGI